MDIVLNLLKQLSATLTPAEFLLVLSVILVSTFVGVRFILKSVNKGGIGGLLFRDTANTSNEMKEIKNKVDSLLTRDTFEKGIEDSNANIKKLAETSDRESAIFQENVRFLQLMRQEMQQKYHEHKEELEELQNSIALLEAAIEKQINLLKTDIAKNQEHTQRILSQVENVDDRIKAAMPEFRSNFKEITGGLKDLSRDVAVLTGTVQAQINTFNAIKLR